MKRALLLIAMLAPLLGYSQSNVLYGTVSDYGIAPQSGIKCTLTLVSPNPRVVDGVFVRRDPIERTTSTNGYFSFTNIIWGKYTFQIAGKTTTEFGIYVQTNSTGSIPLGSLATTVTPPGPNPATNYYTMTQVDALIANVTAGTNGGYVLSSNGFATNLFVYGGINMDSNQVAPSWGEGKVFYDTTQHTLAFYNDNTNVMVNVGSEQLIRVRNRTGSTIPDGSAVYINGAQGQVPTIALAIATNTLMGQAVGLVTADIEDQGYGYVTVQGLVNGLNTSAYADGATLYLSTNVPGGWMTNTASGAIQIGYVAYSHNNQGKLLVNIVPDPVGQTQWPYTAGMFWATGGVAVGASPNQPHLTSSGAGGSTLLMTPSPAAAPDSVLAVQPNITLASGVSFSSVDAGNANNLPMEFRASEFLLNDVVNGGRLRAVASGDSGMGVFAEGSLSGDPVPLTLRASEIRLVPGGGEATGTNVFVEGDLGLASLFASNSITLGRAYPTVLTSSSAGLSIDQPVAATSFTGSGSGLTGIPGASITGTLTNNTTGRAASADSADSATTASRVDTSGAAPDIYVAIDSDNLTTWTRDGSQWTNIPFATASTYATNLASTTWGGISNSAAGATNLTLLANGNVGIGTPSPLVKLHVNGNAIITNTLSTSNLTVGFTYPTLLTSDSTGLVTDQPLTVGGVTPSVTIGAGGPSITASGKTLTVGTNVSIGTNVAKLEYGSANTLVVTDGRVGVNKSTPGAALDVSGSINASVEVYSANYMNAASWIGINQKARLYSPATNIWQLRDSGNTKGADLQMGTLTALGATVTNTLTASNLVLSVTNATTRPLDVTRATNIWEDIVFSPSAMNPAGASGAAALVADAGPDGAMFAIDFAAAGTTAIGVNPQMPHVWVPGTAIHPHFHVLPKTANNGDVVWNVKILSGDIGSTLVTNYSGTVTNTLAGGTNQHRHLMWDMPEGGVTLTNTAGPSTMMLIRIERNGGDTADTYPDPISIISFDVHYRWGGSPVPFNP